MKLSYLSSLRNIIVKPLTMTQLPLHIQLEPTTYCNLACKACMRSKFLHHARHLPLEEFQRIIAHLRPAKISLSGGGEPFMHPQIFEMITFAKSLGSSINTTTNGTLLTTELCEQIVKSGLDLLKVSIDGATRETYQHSRGEDRFLQILEGIRTLSTVKQRLGSPTPFIRFNYVMLHGNYDEMADTIELANELDVDAIYFQPLELTGIEERHHDLVGDLTSDMLLHAIQQARDREHALNIETNLKGLMKEFPLYWKKYALTPQQAGDRLCILPWFSTYITLEGTVHPCCSSSAPPTCMGNIFEESIDAIWNGTKYQQFRQAIRAGQRPFAICKNCVPRTIFDFIRYSRILPGFLR